MADVEKLQEQELIELDGELNLEDLIILGDDSKIPIRITFPKADGTSVEAKALVKQLKVQELENIKVKRDNAWKYSIAVLEKSLFKQDGTSFNTREIRALPLGVADAIAKKVMELSGVEVTDQKLVDF